MQKIIKEKLNECPSCVELYSENLRLREAFEKVNPFVAANHLKKLEDKQSMRGNRILRFEICIPVNAIIQYIDSLSDYDSHDNIWITGRLDVSTGGATFSNCGKIRENTNGCQNKPLKQV